jgi:two-component system, chemotaxis family, chemotaxis protein CheY
MRFLVVDDSATMRRIIKNQLKLLGFDQVVEAEDALAALATLEADFIDFLITDWAMPRMSGLSLVQKVRATRAGDKLPILMVTAIGREEEVRLAAAAGVDGYIVKPFEHATLKEKIAQILGKQRNVKARPGTDGVGRAADVSPGVRPVGH